MGVLSRRSCRGKESLMTIGPVLELATLPQRHPIGEALLKLFGAQVVIRLSRDPVYHADAVKREVVVERNSPAVGGQPQGEVREMGWSNLPQLSETYLAQVRITKNANDITEDAAIGVMALLVHELEQVTIREVLPLGSGGDYLIAVAKQKRPLQVEVSGIRADKTGVGARARLSEKCRQVLTKSPAGFASVSTFCWKDGRHVHSYLHYVEKAKLSKAGRKSRRRKK
jgi:hypothetical protein